MLSNNKIARNAQVYYISIFEHYHNVCRNFWHVYKIVFLFRWERETWKSNGNTQHIIIIYCIFTRNDRHAVSLLRISITKKNSKNKKKKWQRQQQQQQMLQHKMSWRKTNSMSMVKQYVCNASHPINLNYSLNVHTCSWCDVYVCLILGIRYDSLLWNILHGSSFVSWIFIRLVMFVPEGKNRLNDYVMVQFFDQNICS